jgi:hypothetical protein
MGGSLQQERKQSGSAQLSIMLTSEYNVDNTSPYFWYVPVLQLHLGRTISIHDSMLIGHGRSFTNKMP